MYSIEPPSIAPVSSISMMTAAAQCCIKSIDHSKPHRKRFWRHWKRTHNTACLSIWSRGPTWPICWATRTDRWPFSCQRMTFSPKCKSSSMNCAWNRIAQNWNVSSNLILLMVSRMAIGPMAQTPIESIWRKIRKYWFGNYSRFADVLCCAGIVPSEWPFVRLVKTINDVDLRLSRDRRPKIQNAGVTKCDIIATNGIIHEINDVISTKQQRRTAGGTRVSSSESSEEDAPVLRKHQFPFMPDFLSFP